MDHQYFVYILECSDKSYYTGVTNNLLRRLEDHESGGDPRSYTFKRRPVILRYASQAGDIRQAIEWEKQIKGWSRKKKEALFTEDWETIKKLARNYTEYPRDSSADI